MVYKIIRALNTAPIPEFDEPSKLYIELEVEGLPWAGGGFPVTWTRQDIDNYITANYADMLRQAQYNASQPATPKPEPRYDVVDVVGLPASDHLATIKSINTAAAKPIIVTRVSSGQEFDIPCVVTESVKDQFLSGDVVVGDIVIITYCEERIDDAIVIAKVFKSW